MKLKKVLSSILAVSILVTGTYAWQSFSQSATNEIIEGIDYPGGRLHDYFDGSNKDVFVENYGTSDNAPEIYARIRFREYFEYGTDAGDYNADTSLLTVVRGDLPYAGTPDIEDRTTWDIYQYKSVAIPDTESIRTFRDLDLGGEGLYLPTFNQDNTDLSAEINGTFAGTDFDRTTDDTQYDDYIDYVLDSSYPGMLVTASDLIGVSTTHTVEATNKATVMSMSEWIAADAPIGDIWVFDTDGWAYYAAPIEKATASGLLLNSIVETYNPLEEWYYAVDVKAELATIGDWGEAPTVDSDGIGMYVDISDEALGLLNKVSGIMRVENMILSTSEIGMIGIDPIYVDPGDTLSFTVNMDVYFGTNADSESHIKWSIVEDPSLTSGVDLDDVFISGNLIPNVSMSGCTYEITATSYLTPSESVSVTVIVN